MERNRLREKVKRLRAWVMVIVTMVYCLFGGVAMDIWAATNSISIGYYSDGEVITSGTAATITSTDYSTGVEYEDATSGTATLPTASKAGYIFVEWGMGNSGGALFTDSNGDSYTYPAGEATFSTDALSKASSEGMIYLFAQWKAENKINVTYSSEYGTLDTKSEVYGESTNCTDGAATVTLPTVTDEGDNRNFIGWKCYAADSSGNKTSEEEITTLTGYNADIADDYENITVGGYAADSGVSITYPTDTENTGGNIDYYIFEAQFVETKSISYVFKDSDAGAQISSTGYAESVDCYGTTAETITLPIAQKENAFFVEWSIADSAGNLITDDGGNPYSYSAGDVTFSEEELQAAANSDSSTIYLLAQFTDADSITVSYDANDEGATQVTQVTYTQETDDQTTVTFTLAEAPTREGYTFLGWQSSEEADSTTYYPGGAEVTYVLTNSAITFTAQWESIENTDDSTETDDSNSENESTESTTPEESTPEDDTAEENTSEENTTEESTSEENTTEENTSEENTTEESTPVATTPEETTPETTTIEVAVTEPEIQTISEGTVSLEAGETYYLGEGEWKINGDSTIYEGGNEFYVSVDGDYEFSLVEEN